VGTARQGLAIVGGAVVFVIAVQGGPRLAVAVAASVPVSAEVAIVAVQGVVHVGAPDLRIAAVISAGVGIIAVQLASGNAQAAEAVVPLGALVLVVAAALLGEVGAHSAGCAGILSARVRVVAFLEGTGHALAHITVVTLSAGIAVVTGGLVVHMDASRLGIAGIVGTGVLIIAINQELMLALAPLAALASRAGIAVVTVVYVGFELAARQGVAGIVGAGIAVVADQG